MRQKQSRHEDQGQSKGNIADPSQFLPGLCRYLIGQEIQHHRGPAGIAAPAPPEDQGAEYLCHSVMDRRGFEDACKEIIPEAFDLHIFPADQTKINQHIQADKQLDDAPGMPVFSDIQENSQRDGASDITEVK